MDIGIISYLPADSELRRIRKQLCHSNIEWYLSKLPGRRITVVSQNYEQGDYFIHPLVSYIDAKPNGPGPARNILLNKLYSSNDTWGLICDDDIILYDYYGALDLIEELEKNESRFKGIDLITGKNPVYTPFKKLNYNDKHILTHWKFERKGLNNAQPFAVYRNLDKFYRKEIFYKKIITEDVDFSIQLCLNKVNANIVSQWILKDYATLTSTIYSAENRSEEEKKAVRYVLKQRGLEKMISPDGKIDWSYITKQNSAPSRGYIKREKVWSFTERETPKEYRVQK